ncbi:MAG: gatC [Francisellaceae bacterium]|nr:gatC [Francisellaceae bacterium]
MPFKLYNIPPSEIKMSINSKDILQVAHLARLNVEQGNTCHSLQEDLSRIMKMIDQINEIDTQNITPQIHSLATKLTCREDKVIATDQRDLLQSIAPLTEAGLYLVPTVRD